MPTNARRKQQAIQLADELYSIIDVERFDLIPLGSIDEALTKLRRLDFLFGGSNAEIKVALAYLEKMKRPRTDRFEIGYLLKDKLYGLRISAHSL